MTNDSQINISNLNCQAIGKVQGIKELLRLLRNEVYEYSDTKHLEPAVDLIAECAAATEKILEELDSNIYA